MNLLTNFWDLLLDAAPWLLLGYLFAAVIKVWLPGDLLSKHLGQENKRSVFKAALFGAPLPLCSCGVLPAAMGLHRAGASRGATVSFLISTPETGVDSVAVSYGLLGPLMAIIRPIAALFSAIIAGLLAGRGQAASTAVEPKKSCCHNHCDSTEQIVPSKWRQGWLFASKELIDDSAGWLLAGLVMAALIVTFVPTSFLTQWGSGLPAMLVMILIGLPMYICATASTPIAVGLLAAGVSPGAVLVFLLAGPVTNGAALMLVRKELGNRALVAYLGSVAVVAIIFGYITDALAHWWPDGIITANTGLTMLPPWLSQLAAVLFTALLLASFWRRWRSASDQHVHS
ncbi:SO_0444 family Cu/Zn efflux transporter [Gallaecimonas sp. GXIMD1310]|uniref:SO_0444 family Cu/Zn efflux transporter n=1 Tax=Gallaecimonas sp. GXIMD1310 TaxID=3131926 RepID=UPI003244F04F